MIPFLSDRRVLATSAAVITAAILFFLIGTYPQWRKAIGVDGGPDLSSLLPAKTKVPDTDSAAGKQPADGSTTAARDAAPALLAAPPGTKVDAAGALSPKAGENQLRPQTTADAAPASASSTSLGDQPAASAGQPTFDIVRVEPSGDSVIAGRAKPGADVVLLDQGKPIARAKADTTGQVAFVPPALAPGEHSLMLSVGEPAAMGAVSSQSVAVSVAPQAKSPPMVALIAPGQPTKLLSAPAAVAPSSTPGAPGTDTAASSAPVVAVSSIDVEDQGGIYATGKATPNSHCRVYLNGSFVAAVTAGADGNWSLKIKHGMRPGRYSVRVDEVQSAAGQVQARAEVPFEYPNRAAEGASLLRPKVAPRTAGGAGPQAAGSLTVATGGAAPTTSGASATAATPADGAVSSSPSHPEAQTASADPAASASYPGTDPTIVSQLLTTKVIRGDSLWRISRKMLGHGMRYTQIYAANTGQIRDPKLIYPGQIFVMPQATP